MLGGFWEWAVIIPRPFSKTKFLNDCGPCYQTGSVLSLNTNSHSFSSKGPDDFPEVAAKVSRDFSEEGQDSVFDMHCKRLKNSKKARKNERAVQSWGEGG